MPTTPRPNPARWGRHITWTPYATHEDGSTMFCSVTYNHATRGTWTFVSVAPDGTERRTTARLTRGWTLTEDGEITRDDRRAGLA